MKNKKIYKGKNGIAFFEYSSWCHRYKVLEPNGKVLYKKKKGFATEEVAEESYYKYEELFKEQQREFYVSVNKDIMFKDYLIYWFEKIYSVRTESTTQSVGDYIIYQLIIPNIEYDVKIDLVTTDYLNEIISKAAKITPSAGCSARTIIVMAMKDAVIGGYITYNPSLSTIHYQRPKAKIRVLSENQMKKFLILAKDTNWYLEILLALFCGLRKGEILGLKFKDFNLENKTLTIERQLVPDFKLKGRGRGIAEYKRIERCPKTKNSIRRIKAPDIVIEELLKRKELIEYNKQVQGVNYIDNDYISCQKNGISHAHSSINQCIDVICKKLSLPHITVHGLRHMCATILLEQGAPLAKISAYLGYASIHVTFEYYCEVMDEKEKILAFMNNIFAVEVGEN